MYRCTASAHCVGRSHRGQRSLLSWAQVWPLPVSDEQLRTLVMSNPHSPPKFRVNGPVRNIDAWYKEFDVKTAISCICPPENRVRICEIRVTDDAALPCLTMRARSKHSVVLQGAAGCRQKHRGAARAARATVDAGQTFSSARAAPAGCPRPGANRMRKPSAECWFHSWISMRMGHACLGATLASKSSRKAY